MLSVLSLSVCLSVCSSHWAMLSSIRLRLWAFKLDYETTESVSAVSIMSVCLFVTLAVTDHYVSVCIVQQVTERCFYVVRSHFTVQC